jgi:DNA-binding transcriptional ArsR family regulator
MNNSTSQPGREQRDGEQILQVLADTDNRAILGATAATPHTAQELADRCDIPLSTVYRKIETLRDAGFVQERLRCRPHGKDAREYRLRMASIQISFTPPGDATDEIAVRGVEGDLLKSAEDAVMDISADGGTAPEHAEVGTDAHERLASLFVAVMGTDTIVEERNQDPSVRFAIDPETSPQSERLREFVAAQARADGLLDAIGGPDQNP